MSKYDTFLKKKLKLRNCFTVRLSFAALCPFGFQYLWSCCVSIQANVTFHTWAKQLLFKAVIASLTFFCTFDLFFVFTFSLIYDEFRWFWVVVLSPKKNLSSVCVTILVSQMLVPFPYRLPSRHLPIPPPPSPDVCKGAPWFTKPLHQFCKSRHIKSTYYFFKYTQPLVEMINIKTKTIQRPAGQKLAFNYALQIDNIDGRRN